MNLYLLERFGKFFKFISLENLKVNFLRKDHLLYFPNFYGQRPLLETKVFSIDPYELGIDEFRTRLEMKALGENITSVERDLKHLEVSYANSNVCNKELRKNKDSKSYFANFYIISGKISNLANAIEQNADYIALETTDVADGTSLEKIQHLLGNAKKIKQLFANQKKCELESINRLVDALCHLIEVVEDTIEINKTNLEIDEIRANKYTEEEKEFIKDILERSNELIFKKQNYNLKNNQKDERESDSCN